MGEHEYEFRVEIAGVYYGMDALESGHIRHPLFDKFSVGLACCAQLDIKYWIGALPEPPKGARVVPQIRTRGSKDPWKQVGVFYIDIRTTKDNVKTLTCYDSMMKSDVAFNSVLLSWPTDMKSVGESCAQQMGIQLDERTVLSTKYLMDKVAEDTPIRTVLQYIAAAHGGNWVITSEDKLLLVPLFSSMPSESNYLITEYGENIVIGGDRILV